MGTPKYDLIEELTWRGMIQDIMPGTQEQLNKEVTIGYIGFDPTAESLHIGSLVPILLLVHLQRAGHKPIALVGGATGMVGDPSGKSEERNLLDAETLQKNVAGVKKQLEKFLDFTCKENPAELANNYDWFKDMSFLNFIRDVGKHITVNYMMSKDSVKKRLETGISFTEFSYQLLQGYDFYWLNKHKGCKLQMGGADQWGNMTTGTELIRRLGGHEAFAFTTPLITKSDGSKFGKTEKGNIWLDAKLTSPYEFYQFWLNVADEDAERYIKIYTFLNREEIEALIEAHRNAPHLRILQKKLAEEVTVMVHHREAYNKAVTASEILFGKGTTEQLQQLEESEILDIFKGVPQHQISLDLLLSSSIIDFLSQHTQVFPSKGEARRMIQANGVSINKQKINESFVLNETQLLKNKFLLIQKGKKEYHLITVTR
ncbi:MAG: tyrosine--tRNA ligase [Flavobacteriales bacterium]|nr:tyrosine--tRNA ligase [Flavobacteriales bacterium]